MATRVKSFNLRNGVQVDNDNFIVTSLGLVGVGTTIPTEIIDVYGGNIKTEQGVIANNLEAVNSNVSGISTFNRINTTNNINVGITSISSGIITSTTGIVTYYGDGGRLLNLPTSQWLDVDVGLGFTSIYAQGFVGVGTVDPRYLFQVSGNNNISLFENGVGIDNTGNIRATGIVTASQFYGNGSTLSDINASNISSGTLDNSLLPTNINISGIITAQNYFNGNLVGVADTANDVNSSSIIEIQGLSVSGVSTVNNLLTVSGSIGIGTLSTNGDIHVVRSGISSIRLTSTSSASLITLGRNGSSYFTNNGQIRYGNTDQSLDFINFGNSNINFYNNSGVIGPSGNYNWYSGSSVIRMILTADGKLGVGITNPVEKIHVVGTSTVTSNSYVGANLFVNTNATIGGNLSANQLSLPGIIFNSTSVGISTNNPNYTLQVGSNPLSVNGGVGIGSNGFIAIKNDISAVRNINSSGIVTCSQLNIAGNGQFGNSVSVSSSITAGTIYGNGSNITELNADNINVGTIKQSIFPDSLSLSGIITSSYISTDENALIRFELDTSTNPGKIIISGFLGSVPYGSITLNLV